MRNRRNATQARGRNHRMIMHTNEETSRERENEKQVSLYIIYTYHGELAYASSPAKIFLNNNK